MHCWHSYLDESGNFARPDERVVIAGLLFRRRLPPEPIRRAIERALPGVTWPPHATHLHSTTFRSATLLMGRASASEVSPAVVEVAELLQHSHDPAATALRNDIEWCHTRRQLTHRLDRDLLRKADDWLQDDHRQLAKKMRATIKSQRLAMWDLLSTLKDEATAIAIWQRRDHASPESASRFFKLLDGLCERLFLLVGSKKNTLLLLSPGTRHDLQHQTLQPLAGLRKGQHGNTTIVIDKLQPYDETAHPELVLADFIANHLGYACRKGTWQHVKDSWTCAVPLERVPSNIGSKLLPTLAADGRPRRALSEALAGQTQGTNQARLQAARPPWAREQAQAWIDTLRGEQ